MVAVGAGIAVRAVPAIATALAPAGRAGLDPEAPGILIGAGLVGTLAGAVAGAAVTAGKQPANSAIRIIP
jgi:hypothetical protein